MKYRRPLAALLLSCAGPAFAGPPYNTDDPEPTDTGHWEIYAGTSLDGIGNEFGGEAEVELNYGPVKDVQLTVGLPVAYSHDSKLHGGLGDVEVAAKYRFLHDPKAGLSVAIFPAVTLPTGTNGFGAGKTTALLPIWAQKDMGRWSLFGGGGYAINPGSGNNDYWVGGIALTHDVSDRLNIGVEATREGPTSVGDRATNTLGLGIIRKLKAPFSLLLRGGPSWDDGQKPGYHLYAAIGLDL